MNRRQRVLAALNFEETNQVPKDLGGMRSSSISCFNYGSLRNELNLEDRVPIVYDTGQMLAIPERDVLDALDCDIAFIEGDATNAYDVRNLYKPYNFNNRLKALVKDPDSFSVDSNGTVHQYNWSTMPESSVVFNSPHAGQKFDVNNLYLEPLDEVKEKMKKQVITDKELEKLVLQCEKARKSTDRAIFLSGFDMRPNFVGGVANGSMICLLEPKYMHEHSKIKMEYAIKNYEKIVPVIKDYVDIILAGNNDMGTQEATIVAPELSNEFFLEYFKQGNDVIHSLAPHMKTFLHSCGALYEILDNIIDAHFDILNPVQWTAGGHSYKEWKDKGRNKITFWGGGVDTQHVLPLKNPEFVYNHAKEIVDYMKKDGGFVFCNIHNITAEIDPKNIVAMYKAACE